MCSCKCVLCVFDLSCSCVSNFILRNCIFILTTAVHVCNQGGTRRRSLGWRSQEEGKSQAFIDGSTFAWHDSQKIDRYIHRAVIVFLEIHAHDHVFYTMLPRASTNQASTSHRTNFWGQVNTAARSIWRERPHQNSVNILSGHLHNVISRDMIIRPCCTCPQLSCELPTR